MELLQNKKKEFLKDKVLEVDKKDKLILTKAKKKKEHKLKKKDREDKKLNKLIENCKLNYSSVHISYTFLVNDLKKNINKINDE